MRRARLGLILVGLFVPGCFETKACTLRGCRDQAVLSIRRADGARPRLHVVVVVDGRRVECAAPQEGTFISTTCDGDVRVTSREVQDCREEITSGAKILTCKPNGRFEQVVEIAGAPASVAVQLGEAGTIVAEKTFAPQYFVSQPNGPDCEPTCRQWSDTLNLP